MGSKGRAVIGMSGGVDSSVAAWMLQDMGYEVIGITMKVWQKCMSHAEEKCCGPQAVADARSICHKLGIPHYVIDEAKDFERIVIDYFTAEYQKGRTPNPCVVCNEHFKFGSLLKKTLSLDATYMATGHYAIIEEREGRMVMRKGADERKDQSYFLFSLSQDQLRHALMPLGAMLKPEVREVAKKLGMKTYDKEDSHEICFVPGNNYSDFLEKRLGADQFHPGGIYEKDGTFVSEHDGIERFTIGQRKGLGGGSLKPRYVIDIDATNNRVIVGDQDDLLTNEFFVDRTNWVSIPELVQPMAISAKIRYAHSGAPAHIEPAGPNRAKVTFTEPQRAVTPGQACVFYDGDVVIGGGWIERQESFVSQSKNPVASDHTHV